MNIIPGGKMKITSEVFEEGSMIPAKYTCDGVDVSPPLNWSAVPYGTVSLALICDGPDAPMGVWVHWVLFNIPPDVENLPEGVQSKPVLDSGAVHGKNNFGRYGYGGPCPPGGTHRYYFKLYALDRKIESQPGITKKELLEKMEGHILAKVALMGRYARQ